MKSLLVLCLLLIAVNGDPLWFKPKGIFNPERKTFLQQAPRWLPPADVFIYHDQKKYTTADGSLKVHNFTHELGRDKFGELREERTTLSIENMMFAASVTTYEGHPMEIYSVHFFEEFNKSSIGDSDKINIGLPCFKVESGDVEKGYISYGGGMFGGDPRIGKWDTNADIHSGIIGGPLVIFDKTGHVVILSTFSQFMITSIYHDRTNNAICYGIMGTVDTIPGHFRYDVIMYESFEGVDRAMEEWGRTMRFAYDRDQRYRESDFTINYLGFWTDGGAYYFYHTEPNKTYEETIFEVKEYVLREHIPYRYVQYDSWWYYKDNSSHNDVTRWEPMPDVFPHGLRYMWEKTHWQASCHNRQWSKLTPYARQNGGMFNFIVEDEVALPMDPFFWEELFNRARMWGLIAYEQDHLDQQFAECKATRTNVYVARDWLMQMGDAARKNDLTIQYCMSNPRHALQSLEIPVVTHARVSGDYRPGSDQWKIGVTSLFAEALGVAPFKDNFFTSSVEEPGNPYGMTETHPELQAAIATLSTGPVAPSDKVNYTDHRVLLRCCNEEGLVLRPFRPALPIDSQIHELAFADGYGPKGEVYTTFSEISGLFFGIILAADMKANYTLTPFRAGFERRPNYLHSHVFAAHYAWENIKPVEFSDHSPLELRDCGTRPFCLYHTAPMMRWRGHDLLIAGELTKFVPMSYQRTRSYWVHEEGSAGVELMGRPEEIVEFWIVLDGQWRRHFCRIHFSGTARLDFERGCE